MEKKDWLDLDIAAMKRAALDNRGSIVKHFKGNLYLLEDLVMMEGKSYVLYKGLYGDCDRYVRPVREFFDWVAERPDNKAGNKLRFEFVCINDVTERGEK